MKPKGFEELRYDKETYQLITAAIEYQIIERDGKRFAKPVGKSHGSVGIGDNTLRFESWWPLEDIACSKCGVYGLVHTICIGEYACANCGDKCVLPPTTESTVQAGLENHT